MEREEILILTNDEGKVCSRCGKRKPLTHFYRSRHSRDTYQSYCISCQQAYRWRRGIRKDITSNRILDNFKIDALFSILMGVEASTKREAARVLVRMAKALEKAPKSKKQK